MATKLEWPGERLKELRQKAHLTQEELARDIGVSVYTVVNWERGHQPQKDTIIRLAEYFNCDPRWLAYGVTPEHNN